MFKKRSFPLFIGLIVAGAVLIFLAPRWADRFGAPYDENPAVEKMIGKIEVKEGRADYRPYRFKEFSTLSGTSDLHHLGTLQVQTRGQVNLEVGGYVVQLTGPALAVFERWTPSDDKSPILIHLISGSLNELTAGEPGKLYVLHNGEMTDAKGAAAKKSRALRISAVSVGEPPAQPVTAEPATPPSPADSEPLPAALSNEYLDGEIVKEAEQFQRCQSNAVREHGMVKGHILVGLTINPDGKVAEAQILSSTFQDERLFNCLLQVFRRVQFRSFNGPPIVRSYPLTFE